MVEHLRKVSVLPLDKRLPFYERQTKGEEVVLEEEVVVDLVAEVDLVVEEDFHRRVEEVAFPAEVLLPVLELQDNMDLVKYCYCYFSLVCRESVWCVRVRTGQMSGNDGRTETNVKAKKILNLLLVR